MPRRPGKAGAVVFALLVVLTIAAFGWSQRLKRNPLVIDRVTFGTKASHSFTPNGDCRFDRERVRFRVTRSDHAIVQVAAPGGRLVITLARDKYLKRYHFFTFFWDGRSRNDGIAPPGRYKLRVKLLDQERSLVPPGVIWLNRAPRRAAGCEASAKGSS